MNASIDQTCKSRGIIVTDPKEYTQLEKSESASFKELLSALFSGDEAITSFKHQSYKIRKKRVPKHGSNPVLVLVQLGVAFLSTHNYWQNVKCQQPLEANNSSPSAPHQSAGPWARTSIHRLLGDTSIRRLFKNCGGGKKAVCPPLYWGGKWKKKSDRAESRELTATIKF